MEAIWKLGLDNPPAVNLPFPKLQRHCIGVLIGEVDGLIRHANLMPTGFMQFEDG